MKQKIGLIFPRFKYPSGDPPLGVGYIASNLRKNDFDVKIFDTTFMKSYEQLYSQIRKSKFDIIGISVMTTMLQDSLQIAKWIKKHSPGTLVVFGGPHPTVLPKEVLKNPNVDVVCIGEAEQTFLNLVKNLNNLKKVKGIAYKEHGDIIFNDPQMPIENLDSLPFPALDLIDMEKYFKIWFQLDSVSINLKGLGMISSRGCPFNCSYCQPTLFKLFGKKLRKRSPKNIVKEIIHWKQKYNINALLFTDDTFTLDKKWVYNVCDEIIAEDLNIIWDCNTRANLVDEQMFKHMREAGLRKVSMGIESGSQRVLDQIYQKQIKIEDVIKSTNFLNRIGIKIQGHFMLGAPTETEEEINKTISFAKQLKIDEATFSITTPLPCTYLYEKTKHCIEKDISKFDYYKTPVYRKNKQQLSPRRLNYLKKKALLSFYLSSNHFIPVMKQLFQLTSLNKSILKLKRF